MTMVKIDDNSSKGETMADKEVQKCRCLELEERSLKAEARCIELEIEIQKARTKFEALEAKFKELESEKTAVEKVLKNVQQLKPVLENVVDLTGLDEEDSIIELAMVNKALECEKQVAETEVEIWKAKFEKLLAAMQKLHKMGALRDGDWYRDEHVKLGLELAGIELPVVSGGKATELGIAHIEASGGDGLAWQQSSDSPYSVTPAKDDTVGRSRCAIFQSTMSSHGRVRKLFSTEVDGNNIGPSTPANGKQVSVPVVDLCDSDEEPRNTTTCDSNGIKCKPDYGSEKDSDSRNNIKERSIAEDYEDEDVGPCEANTSSLPCRKRKRVISSDSEGDDEDNIPILILKRLKPPKQETLESNTHSPVSTPAKNENVMGRRMRSRPVLPRKSKQRVPEEILASSEPDTKERLQGIPTTDDVQDDESEEESESASESKSLDGFIVDDNEESDTDGPDESRSDESFRDAPDDSDEDVNYANVISRFRRDKNQGNMKWEYEGEMLADFGKDPELCMRAVCVLYRQQTADERASRSSHYFNKRGFNKFDAKRGTRLGEFLTDGDPNGDLKKTVEELRRFDAEAIELCRVLATHYSKQLFQIYKNQEDPFFTSP